MGILRSALLLGAGAAVGYLASRRAAYVKANPSSASLIKYQSGALELNPESQMGKFFDSSLGKPLQPYALWAVEFAARVRQGMQEKEAELHAKVERQKQDARPGSLDLWDRDMSPNEASELRRAVAERELIEVESEIAHLEEARQARLRRDRELGEDFFN